MSPLHDKFAERIAPGGHVLDAGCGSGRDAKAFASRGFTVTAFDGSPALAKLASEHCGFPVQVRTFTEVEEVEAYDGIWSCASLLHVPAAEMTATLRRLWRALKPGGAFYVSFKLGEGERSQGGRTFTDADEPTVRLWFSEVGGAELTEVWVTSDSRPERNDQWLNAIAFKPAIPLRKLVTGGADPFLPHLSRAISGATEIAIAVSFVKAMGLKLLLPD
jgi:SAM-dependent methyltransferase